MPDRDDLDSILHQLESEDPAKADPSVEPKSVNDAFASTLDDLDRLPVSVSILDDIVDYPARTYPGEETVVVSTRIPISMLGQFEEFRDKIGSRMPKEIWKTNGDLARWCIIDGFKKLRKIQEQLDKGEVDASPLLAAQLFLERTGGKLVAHANTRNDAKEKAARTADMINDMMANGEWPQAANAIQDWFEGARQMRKTSPYWESAMIKALIRAPGISANIIKLIQNGQISDPEILDQYEDLVDIAKRKQVEELDNLPTTAPEETDEDDQSTTTKYQNSSRRSKQSKHRPG